MIEHWEIGYIVVIFLSDSSHLLQYSSYEKWNHKFNLEGNLQLIFGVIPVWIMQQFGCMVSQFNPDLLVFKKSFSH